MSLPKPAGVFRVYSQNINGLRLDKNGGDLCAITDFLNTYQCDAVGFSEVNLDVSKYQVRRILSDTLNRAFDCNRMSTSTSEVPFEGFYKPGGTLTAVFNHHTSRYQSQFSDPLGRWCSLSLTGKHGRTICFITVYQVVDHDTAGPYTVYQQQLSLLKLADRLDKPRRAFIVDLSKYVDSLATPDTEIILMGDLNEVVGFDGSGFSKITSDHDLVDIMAHFHPIADEVATYARGTKRLDYIFCTPNLLPAILHSGVEPFNEHIPSDHRSLFVDWDEKALFGSKTAPMAAKNARRLQSANLQAKGNYILSFHKYCEKHNVFKRVTDLEDNPHPSWRRAEALDRDITRAMLHAEKTCRHLGTDPWSPTLQKARQKVEILKLSISSIRNNRDYSKQITRLLINYADLLEVPADLPALKAAYNLARLDLNATLKDASRARSKFLQQQQNAARIAKTPKDVLKWKQVQKGEEIKAMYAKLRFIRKDSNQGSGISTLQVPLDPSDDPKTCTAWRTVESPEAITTYLLERNQKHFGQAHGTPFTVEPLASVVDFNASTTACEAILFGTFSGESIDALTQLFIHQLQLKTAIDFLPPSITSDDMQSKFAIWNESTSTSPSGRHLGHYRSLLPKEMPSDPRAPRMESCRAALVDLHHSMINLALKNGRTYTRWHKVVNVMLEKEPGNPKIHRLRVIHLYEADYNLILSLKARSLVHHAEDNSLLNDSLYGARPGRTAHDPVGIEETVAEITRLSRKPCIKNAEDATACYDRILPGLGNLASRCHGLHRLVAIVQGATLEEVHYHLKTSLGITEDNYKHCDIHPIYGTGQGSGNSPTVWLVISSVLFNCYETKAHGALFESPDRSVSLMIYRVGFVDDTCGYVNRFQDDSPPTPEMLISMLTNDSQLWSDLLWLSGGALELPKCTYHYWNYKFKPVGTPFLQASQVGPPVVIQTGDRHRQETVPFRSAYNAYKTLGYWKSPSGRQATQFKVLKKKCDNHARIVSTSALSRREAWTYYFSIYLTSPGYPLPLSHFSPSELHKLETKSLPAIIAKCGFNRNSSRDVLYGPVRFNGGGFRPFRTEQGVGQLQYLVKHWTSALPPGKAQRIAVAWSQVNVGVSWSIFRDVSTPLPHFESQWLRVLRNFLHTIKGQLRFDNPYVPAVQRYNDSHIMDHVLASGQFTDAAIKQVNYCRLYLQAITISDISAASGHRLLDGVTRGTECTWGSRTVWHHTNQTKPSVASWKVWERALNLFSTKSVLHLPLLHWLLPPSDQRRVWPSYYDPDSDVLILSNDGVYTTHLRCCNTFDHDSTGIIPSLPSGSYAVALDKTFSGWRVQHYLTTCAPAVPIPDPFDNSFLTYISKLEPWDNTLLQHIQFVVPPEEVFTILTSTDFRACSDGSALARQGTYGWALATADRNRLAFGAGPVDGHDPQSFRSEGQGMLSVVRLLFHLRQWQSSSATFTGILATDNSGLLDRVREQSKIRYPVPNLVFQPDWDVVESIVRTVESMEIDPVYKHVKGHQDETKSYDSLSFLSQLNVDADKYAGEYQQAFGAYRPLIPLSPTRPIALDISGKTIHRNFKSAIRDAAHTQPLFDRLIRRNCWLPDVPDRIDWDAHRLATNDPLRRTHYVKLCHDMLPTGKLVNRYHPSYPDWCPLCRCPAEDHKHILRCPHHTRVQWRTKFLEQLSKKCSALHTDPVLSAILLNGLRCWLSLTPFDESGIPEQYYDLLQDQRDIGWYHVFIGRFSTRWASLQNAYLRLHQINIKGVTGEKWTRQVATVVITAWCELWDSRNKDRHGRDSAHKKLALHDQATREIELLYQYHDKVLQRDRSIFSADLQEHLLKPTRVLRQWINTNQKVILKSSADAKIFSLLNVRTLQSYFQDPL